MFGRQVHFVLDVDVFDMSDDSTYYTETMKKAQSAATKKKARSIVLTVRLSEDEHRRFQKLAEKSGFSLATLVRVAVLDRETSS